MRMKKRVIIVGGGASGLTAAIQAARAGADVTVLEHMDRPGKKILSTGNGKCNMTNRFLSPSCYRSSQPEFPMKALSDFSVEQAIDFFKGLGILPKDKNGYIYPNSEQASSVLDVLRLENDRLGVKILCGRHVKEIRRKKAGGFQAVCLVKTEDRETEEVFSCDSLILAAGSKAAPSTGSDGSGYDLAEALGHRIIKPLPALVQLICSGREFKALAGIRTEAFVRIFDNGRLLAEDRGELQLTDYGISGIPVFQVSRYAAVALDKGRKVTAVIDLLPSMGEKELLDFLMERKKHSGYKKGGDFLTGVLNKKLAQVLLKKAGISIEESISRADSGKIKELARLISRFEADVTGTKPFANAQVCCGGVDTREVDERTMESRLVPGLYFSGEILDVDGICGGYNLQWAWSSGSIAGKAAAGS